MAKIQMVDMRNALTGFVLIEGGVYMIIDEYMDMLNNEYMYELRHTGDGHVITMTAVELKNADEY